MNAGSILQTTVDETPATALSWPFTFISFSGGCNPLFSDTEGACVIQCRLLRYVWARCGVKCGLGVEVPECKLKTKAADSACALAALSQSEQEAV